MAAYDSSGASSCDNSSGSSDVDAVAVARRAQIYDDVAGATPRTRLDLHTSCAVGHYDHVRRLVAVAATAAAPATSTDVNAKNKGGWTPLMYAAYAPHDNIVDFLLENGARVNDTTEEGATALMLAAGCGNESVVYFLAHRGAIVDAKDGFGLTALFHATRQGHQNVVKLLLELGADIEVSEPETGFSPLMEASKQGHELIVNTLLISGADVNKVGCHGDTARSLALQYGRMVIVSLIDNFLHQGRHGSVRSEADLDDTASSTDDEYISNSSPAEDLSRVRTRYLPRSSDATDIRSGPAAFASMWTRVREESNGFKLKGSHRSRRSSSSQLVIQKTASPTTQDGDLNFDYPIPQEKLHQHFEDLPSGFTTSESASAQSSDTDVSQLTNENENENENGEVVDYEEEDDRNTFSFPARDKSFSRKSEQHYRLRKQREVRKMRRLSDEKRKAEEERVDAVGVGGTEKDLREFLGGIGLEKYAEALEKEEVDLRTLLTMTEDDLKGVGLNLFGPRRKIMMAITRINEQTAAYRSKIEQAYADKLEVEKQELEIKYKQALKEVDDMKLLLSQERELREMCESVSVEERLAKEESMKKVKELQLGVKQIVSLVSDATDDDDETRRKKSYSCIFDLNSKLC